MWKAGITAKMLIRLLANKKSVSSVSHSKWDKIHLWIQWLFTIGENFADKKFLWLHNNRSLVILLIIYFLVWHPGLGFRSLPETMNQSYNSQPILISSTSPVELKFNLITGCLEIIRPNQKVYHCFAMNWNVAPGNYMLSKYLNQNTKYLISMQEQSSQAILMITEASQNPIINNNFSYITFDEISWPTLYPYLQQNNLLIIY